MGISLFFDSSALLRCFSSGFQIRSRIEVGQQNGDISENASDGQWRTMEMVILISKLSIRCHGGDLFG
ncbi:MAG: hypothetical protein APR56_07705 [Methanosaeta sp. SDB]|nr:MAG: hypothetical protein APR56_07705 [Methanosaeta sp. SDB]